MKDPLLECINEIANLPNEDKVNIKGKFYTTVDKRVQVFRRHFGRCGRITTTVHLNDIERVVVDATVAIFRNNVWETIGNDYAEEFRSQGPVNKTSALENCCTSAIGRALASCGLGGGEYASSFELDNAINNKASAPDTTQGYSIRSEKGKIIEYAPDSTIFLKHLRVYLKDEKAETSQSLYKINQAEIKKAKTNSDNEKDIKAFEKLINLYEIDEQTK